MPLCGLERLGFAGMVLSKHGSHADFLSFYKGCSWRALRYGAGKIEGDSVVKAEFERTYTAFEKTISSASLKAVARHWREICDKGHESQLPIWSDIRPAAIKNYLPIVWSYDYDAVADDFIGRLAGGKITRLSNKPFKGARLSEIRPNNKYPRSLIRAKRVVCEPALYRGQGLVYKTEESVGLGERIVLPLRQEGICPAGIFGATDFKSVSDWKDLSLNIQGEDEHWFSLAGLTPAE
jgi:hypothetical protein